MPNSPEARRLDARLAWSFGAVAGFLLLALGSISVLATTRVAEQEQAVFVDAIASTLAGSASEVGYSGKYHTRQLFERLHRENEALVFLSLVDPEGKVIASGIPEENGLASPPDGLALALGTLETDERALQRRWEHGQHITEVDLPIRGGFQDQVVGVLRVGVATSSWWQILFETSWVIVTATLVLLAMAVPFYRRIASSFSAPVHRQARQLRGILEHAPLHIVMKDATGRPILSSRRFRETGQRSERNATSLERAFAGNAPFEGPTVRRLELDGEGHTLVATRFPVTEGGEEVCWIASDTTALSRASTQRDRFASAVAATPDVVALANAEGRFDDVNPAFFTILGFRAEDLPSIDLWSILVGGDAFLEAEIRATLDEGRAWRGINRLGQKEGRGGSFQVVVTRVAEGGFALYARDVAEEEALRSRLHQSRKLEAIGRVVGGVAHDFNNLLTVILTSADLILHEEGVTPSIRDDAEACLEAGERARELTRQLLTFARREPVGRHHTDMQPMLRAFQPLVERLMPAEVNLKVQAADDVWAVAVDGGRLQQVLMNLVVNARDAMPDGGTVRVEVANRVLNGLEFVDIAVRDDGVGMSTDVRERIFEPFYSTKPQGKGTGLGLSIVHTVVEQCGGILEVQSAPGEGTTFLIRLPRSLGAHQEEPASREGSGAHILVVDDKADVREAIARVLRRAGYTTTLAAGGQEALSVLARDRTVAVVLTDLAMPGMSGVDLSVAVQERFPSVGLVFMSGYREAFTTLGWDPGSWPVVDKPPALDVVVGSLARAEELASSGDARPSRYKTDDVPGTERSGASVR